MVQSQPAGERLVAVTKRHRILRGVVFMTFFMAFSGGPVLQQSAFNPSIQGP